MYDFKWVPEAVRAGLFALTVFLATSAANFSEESIEDPEKWAVSLASGAIAFVGAAVLGVLTKPRV